MTNNSTITPSLKSMYNVPLEMKIILGRKKIKIEDLLKLNKGDMIQLNKNVNESVDIMISGELIAKGELVVVDDKFGVTITETFEN